MYYKNLSRDESPQILASEHYISFTATAVTTKVTADENGDKYVKTGTLLDAGGQAVTVTRSGSSGSYTYALSADPVGIVLQTVNVRYGNQPVALLVEGYVYAERLQGQYITEALDTIKEKLPEIKFV